MNVDWKYIREQQIAQLEVLQELKGRDILIQVQSDKQEPWITLKQYKEEKRTTLIKFRSVLENELIFEIDNDDWNEMAAQSKRIYDWMWEHKAPIAVVYTGNKSLHLRTFFDPTTLSIDPEVAEGIKEYGIDVLKEVRLFFYNLVKEKTGTDPDRSMFAWGSSTKGHMERMEGSTHEKTLKFCSLLSKIPEKKPSEYSVKFMEPTQRGWDVSEFKEPVNKKLRELLYLLKREEPGAQALAFLEGVEFNVEEIPCIKKLLDKGLPKGHRHEGCYSIATLFKRIGIPIEKAKETVEVFLTHSEDFDEKKLKAELKNTEDIYANKDKLFSCGYMRKEHPELCDEKKDKSVCPVWKEIRFIKENEKEKKERGKKEKEEMTLEQIKSLPRWDPNHLVLNRILLKRMHNGEKKEFITRVYLNDGELKEELEREYRSIPENTAPSEDFWEKYGNANLSFKDVFRELRAIQSEFICVKELIFLDLIAFGTISTYFREVFYAYPYFDFYSAEPGCGKSTALKTFTFCSFYGIYTNNPTEAVIFRMIEDSHAMFGIDDIDYILAKPDQYLEIISLLNSSYSKGMECFRIERDKDGIPRARHFDGYGLKAFSHVHDFPYQYNQLKTRCISIIMQEGTPKQSGPVPEKFTEIRDKLYTLRLREHERVKEAYEKIMAGDILQGRNADLFYPLLAIALLVEDQELFERIVKYAKESEKAAIEESLDEWNKVLIQVLSRNELYGSISTTKIAALFTEALCDEGMIKEDRKIDARNVNSRLKKLGFKKEQRKTDNKSWFAIDQTLVNDLKKRYGLSGEQEELENIIPPLYTHEISNLSNLSNSDEGKNNAQKLEELEKLENMGDKGIEKQEQQEDLLKKDPGVRGYENKLREIFTHSTDKSSFLNIAWHETGLDSSKLKRVWEELGGSSHYIDETEQTEDLSKKLIKIAKECGATAPNGASGAEVIMKAVEEGIKKDEAIQFFHDLQVSGLIRECALGRFVLEGSS